MANRGLVRHGTDLVSLFVGLFFLAVGGTFIASSLGAVDVNWRWAGAVGLIAVGLIGLVASLRARESA